LGDPPVALVVASAGEELDLETRDARAFFNECRLFIGDLEFDRDLGQGSFAVFLNHPLPIDGFSFRLEAGCTGWRFDSAALPEYFSRLRGTQEAPRGPDFEHLRAEAAELEAAVLLALEPPLTLLGPHERRRLLEVRFSVLLDEDVDFCPLEFVPEAATLSSRGRDLRVSAVSERVYVDRGVPRLEVHDPREIAEDGWVADDLSRLAALDRPVSGLAADGVTPVLLRLETDGPGRILFRLRDDANSSADSDAGSLRDLSAREGNPLEVEAREFDGRWFAFAFLVAPDDFVRGGRPEDTEAVDRLLEVEASFPGRDRELSLGTTLRLVRPPVLLLHGIWSGAETWRWGLEQDPRFVVRAGDYSEPISPGGPSRNEVSLRSNQPVPRREVLKTLSSIRSRGFAATKVDAVGHSMGGLLLRLHAAGAGGYYEREDNFFAGDLHKLITLDTPHRGSPWGCFLLHDDLRRSFLGRLAQKTPGLGCVDCGALADLRPDSEVLSRLPQAEVASHALAARGGSDIIESGIEAALPEGLAFIVKVLRRLGWLDRLLPPALQHDFAVGRLSQEGALSWPRTTLFSLDLEELALALHFTVTKEERVSRRVIELLNSPVAGADFAASLPALEGGDCPELPSLLPWRRGREGNGAGGSAPGLRIEAPSTDEVFAPGDVIDAVVTAEDGFEPRWLIVASGLGFVLLEEVSSMPARLELEVPAEAIGEQAIIALGVDAAGSYATSEETTVHVVPTAEIAALDAFPAEIELFAHAPRAGIRVRGRFTDEVERDLVGHPGYLWFRSLDPDVAMVDEEGTVSAVRPGRTVVFVEPADGTGEHLATVDVLVVSIRGDYDSDGDVDGDDCRAFETCFCGPFGEIGFEAPELRCRDAFDVDSDGDIDEEDQSALADISDACQQVRFVRGDADARDGINLTDGVVILSYLFTGGPAPRCMDAADTNDSGELNITDAVIIFNWLFLGGPAPQPPSPSTPVYEVADCGVDPMPDDLDCATGSAICS
jgi:pimeloyl-ACP methyl ester carboxylesterase